jgi:predicted alpha/beta superfamily hydrolase
MNRRGFLKLAATTTAATLALPACNLAYEEVSTPSPQPSPMPTIAPTLKPEQSGIVIPNTETWNMVSQVSGQEYRILAGRRGSGNDAPLPVIYITDGNGNFPLLYIMHQQLVDDGYLPPALLVGVDFPFDEWSAYEALRARDFTPTILPENSPYANYFSAGTGGASAFLQFLGEELKPVINSKYDTVADDAMLIGHSLGGLFALYALFERPDLFQRYVVGSPAIWYDNNVILKNTEAFVSVNSDLPAHVFIGSGGNEDGLDIVVQELADTLMGYQYPSLNMTTRVFEGETHLSMIPFFLSFGLRAVHG